MFEYFLILLQNPDILALRIRLCFVMPFLSRLSRFPLGNDFRSKIRAKLGLVVNFHGDRNRIKGSMFQQTFLHFFLEPRPFDMAPISVCLVDGFSE